MTLTATHTSKGYLFTDEIALMLRTNKQKISRWLNNYWKEQKLGKSETDFFTFIELYVFDALRQKGLSTKRILEYRNWLIKTLNVDYPFAYQEFYLYGDELIMKKNGANLVSVKNYGQLKITGFIQPFLEKIEYTGVWASRFYPLGKNEWIVSDPEIRQGEPIIKDTRIDVWTIRSLLKGGETPETISWAYNIPTEAVQSVIKFFSL